MTAVASRFLATRYLGILRKSVLTSSWGSKALYFNHFSFLGLGSCFPAFIRTAFAVISRLIPSLGPLAKWRSVFYWILTSTLDLNWLCPDLVIIDLSRSVVPSSSYGGENRFPNAYPSFWGFSSFFLSIFQIFIFLGTFTHQILRIRVLTLSCK